MFSIAGWYTGTDSNMGNLDSLSSDVPEEEKFLSELKQSRKIYFDLGLDMFWVQADLSRSSFADAWTSCSPIRFFDIANTHSFTSTDSVVALGKLGIEFIIFNYEKLGPNTEQGKLNFWLYMKDLAPEMRLSFWPIT